MDDVLLLILAVVALGVAIGCAVRLWRLRRTSGTSWSNQELMTALGLAVGLLVAVVPLLVAEQGPGREDPEVTAYRDKVMATCQNLWFVPPLPESWMDEQGVDRGEFVEEMRAQLRGSEVVLAEARQESVPEGLREQAESAWKDAEAYVAANRAEIDRIQAALPDPVPQLALISYFSRYASSLRPQISRVEASLSTLAGQPCSAPEGQSEPS